MKSLWDKLSFENKRKIQNSQSTFLSEIVVSELKKTYGWSALTFEHIIFIMQETTGEDTTIRNVNNLFNERF